MRNLINVDKDLIDQKFYDYLIKHPKRIKKGIRPMTIPEFRDKHHIQPQTIYNMRKFWFAKKDTVERLEAVIWSIREKGQKSLAIWK